MDRRRFVTTAATAGLGALAGSVARTETMHAAEADDSKKSGARISNPIALSTYSLWRFRNEAFRDIHRCIDVASEFGFDGVELLLYQIEQNTLLSNSAMQEI
ncbi:MAG: L-ribulose-5-phosphate 3-epimerase [Planctomycetaceae bacterium]|jgi:L-ribulose-5-phosphate 3-epimerase